MGSIVWEIDCVPGMKTNSKSMLECYCMSSGCGGKTDQPNSISTSFLMLLCLLQIPER